MNEYLLQIEDNSFASECYNSNTIEELELDTTVADETDCKTWGITAHEWREQIQLALKAKIYDRDNGEDFREECIAHTKLMMSLVEKIYHLQLVCPLKSKNYDIELAKLETELNELKYGKNNLLAKLETELNELK